MLNIENIDFPNGIIDHNWYTGNESIHDLNFVGCTFHEIRPSAFQSSAFSELHFFLIINTAPIQYHYEIFNGLQSVQHIHFRGVSFQNIDNTFMHSLNRKLNSFIYQQFPHNLILNAFFAAVKMSNLEYITVTSITPAIPRILSAANFTGLRVIKLISLQDFGIELIMEHTFDFVAETLEKLFLGGNQIKHLSYILFEHFFNKRVSALKVLSLLHGNCECSCDFYDLRNMSLIALKTNTIHYQCARSSYVSCTDVSYRQIETCPASPKIHLNKICLEHSCLDSYAYPRFLMRMIDERVIIKSMAKAKFRLLIRKQQGVEHRKSTSCPSKQWIQETMKCFLFYKPNATVEIGQLLPDANLMTFYVIYISALKEVWPLHIVSANAAEQLLLRNSTYSILSIIFVPLVVVCIALGVRCCCCHTTIFKRKNTMGKSKAGTAM